MQIPPDESVPRPDLREEGSTPHPRRWRRRLAILGVAGLLLLLAAIFFGPLLIAAISRSLIVDAGQRHGYTVTVASSSFGWWEGLTLEGIVAQENIPHGIRAEVQSVVAAPRWRGLLGGTLALGRFRIERPHVTLDPARKPPEPPPSKKPPGPKPSPSAGEGRTPDEPLNLEFPLIVVDGTVEVLPSGDRPGLRLEHLQVNGRLRGADRHLNGTVIGDLVAGERREPLRLSGDVVLGDHAREPSGSAQYAVGELDLTYVAPFLRTAGGPVIERGTLRMNGGVRAEGPVLVLVGTAIARDLKLAYPGDPARVFEAPEARLEVKASYNPAEGRLVLERGRLEGAPVDLELEGSALNWAGPKPTAEVMIRPRGRIERLGALLPRIEGLSGAIGGAITLRREKSEATLVGDLHVTDLVWKRPRGESGPGTDGTPIREPKLTTHLEIKADLAQKAPIPASGKIKLIGSALHLDATFQSKNFPDDLHVKGTMGGESPRLLRQFGFAVPPGLGLSAAGAFVSDFEADLARRASHPTQTADRSILERLQGEIRLHGLNLRREGVDVKRLEIRARMGRNTFELMNLGAEVNGGALTAGGKIDLAQPARRFNVHLDVKGVQVTQYLASFVRYFVPLYHIPDGVDGRVGGAVSAKLDLEGPFPPRASGHRKVMTGKGRLTVERGFVEGSPLISQTLSRLGHRQRYEFENLVTGFDVKGDGVNHNSFQARDRELAWGFKGRTGFDTTIDYRLDPGPILERLYGGKERKGKLKGWERILKDALKGLEKAPISLSGTLDAPRLKLDVLPVPGGKTEIPLNDILEGLLGGKKK